MPQHSLDPELSGFIHNLRASLPYLEEFHQQTFVVQLSGDLLNGHNFRVIEDLALLQQVGIRIVLIHGAETQIRKSLTDGGLVCQTEDGILVAEETHLPLIEQNLGIFLASVSLDENGDPKIDWKREANSSNGNTIPKEVTTLLTATNSIIVTIVNYRHIRRFAYDIPGIPNTIEITEKAFSLPRRVQKIVRTD